MPTTIRSYGTHFITTFILSFLLPSTFMQDVEDTFSQGSVDEVDGSHHRKNSTAVIVDAFFKLAFLKVLLVDIGISLGLL